jgi:tRNA(Arg) A34 adenosine deaminase TadA
MCLGGIMWSGIKNIYYGVPSETVEKLTGFDEGFKPNWHDEFKQRGITVYGNIEPEAGEKALKNYMENGLTVYKPAR